MSSLSKINPKSNTKNVPDGKKKQLRALYANGLFKDKQKEEMILHKSVLIDMC